MFELVGDGIFDLLLVELGVGNVILPPQTLNVEAFFQLLAALNEVALSEEQLSSVEFALFVNFWVELLEIFTQFFIEGFHVAFGLVDFVQFVGVWAHGVVLQRAY